MTDFVLVHGAWHGGWCWERVGRTLTDRGHRAHAPTLAGLGDRAGENDGTVGLGDHVDDVVRYIEDHDLRGVTLVGHSYAGIVVREAADRIPTRIAHVILVDGWIAAAGESLLERAPDWFASSIRSSVPEGGHTIPVPPVELLGVTDPTDMAWLESRLTPQPFATLDEPTTLAGAVDEIPGTAIVCRPGSGLPFDEWAEAVGYDIVDLDSGHDAMVSAPAELTDLIVAETKR